MKADIKAYIESRCLCGHTRAEHCHARAESAPGVRTELYVSCVLCGCENFTNEIERRVDELTYGLGKVP